MKNMIYIIIVFSTAAQLERFSRIKPIHVHSVHLNIIYQKTERHKVHIIIMMRFSLWCVMCVDVHTWRKKQKTRGQDEFKLK